MNLHFAKYHGTGNDFIMIDCTSSDGFKLSSMQIHQLCHRRFGIGADGVILIYKHAECNFKMDYFNSDGTQSFCGNGARCASQFALSLGLFDKTASFEAIDGIHHATIENGLISLKMNNVKEVSIINNAYIIDTGSPHYIEFVKDLDTKNIVNYGREIRYYPQYKKEGINVNLVEVMGNNKLKMLTYERGVEDETYSCGTGATAVALAYAMQINEDEIQVEIDTKGGQLKVIARRISSGFDNIFLIGPAKKVYEGDIEI